MNQQLRISTLLLVAGLLLTAACRTTSSNQSSHNITGVFVDIANLHHDPKSNGDTWDHIWAADDNLYTFGCDGGGYGYGSKNVNFNCLTGTNWDELVGSSVNSMSDYGNNGDHLEGNPPVLKKRDWSKLPLGPNWKVTGADSIDGVFYAFIAQNWYGNQHAYGGAAVDPHIRQTVNNMSLIKSTDHGRTWSRPEKVNVLQPMWTNKKFSTAFFFKYGQDGGRTHQDDQNKYVYAISNDGYWDDGSAFYLGRVLRSKLSKLDARDWQYYSNGQWTDNLDAATAVPGLPYGETKSAMGSPIWLASLDKYVTVTWYNPGKMNGWYFPDDVIFEFYSADHPWGPWTSIGQQGCNEFLGDPKKNNKRWYGPTLSPKFIQTNADGSVTAIMLFSGSTWENNPSSLYKYMACPVTFYTQPLPKWRETINDTAATYSDGWNYTTNHGIGDYQGDVHSTTNSCAYCDFTFSGEGLEILTEKYSNLGEIKVILDGETQGNFSLYQDPMPRLYQVPVYRNLSLAPGQHNVRIINLNNDGTAAVIDGFKVYGHE